MGTHGTNIQARGDARRMMSEGEIKVIQTRKKVQRWVNLLREGHDNLKQSYGVGDDYIDKVIEEMDAYLNAT